MNKIKKVLCMILIFTMITSVFLTPCYALVTATDDITAVDFSALDSMADALTAKIELCHSRGLGTDYENSRLALIKLYTGYIKSDYENGHSEHLAYTLNSLNKMYTDADVNLDAYLDGTKLPLTSVHYKTGTIYINGDDICASTYSSDGEIYYFTGFGHGQQVIDDMDYFRSLGFSAIQINVGPNNVIVEKSKGDRTGLEDSDEFSIDTSYITDYIIPVLDKAASCDVAVSLLLSPHYFPAFLYDIYPDLKNENTGFQKYNINHPVAKRVVEVYLDTVLPMVRDCPSLLELCLTNEPHYKTCKSQYDIAAWQTYLKNKYPDIKALNSALSSDYDTFDDVIMPTVEQATPLMYEWVTFNNEYYYNWHCWMADIVKRNAPSVPVSAKTMSYTDDASQRIMYGANVEQFNNFSDINGSNAWNTLYKYNTTQKLQAYDLLDSVGDKPIINSEDHIIYDISQRFYDSEDEIADFAQHCYTDVWQGAVHGRNANMYWIWDRTYVSSDSSYNCVLTRPDAIASMSDASLDVNRLSAEVNALNSDSDNPDAYILYSDTTRVYSRMSSDYVTKAYNAAIYAGKTVRFVTETSISQMQDGKLLIIPNCTNVPDSTLQAIKNYIAAGNKVLLLGRCLQDNEYDKQSDILTLSYIYTHAKVYGSNPLSKIVESILKFFNKVIKFLSKFTENPEANNNLDYAVTKNITGELFVPFAGVKVSDEQIAEQIIKLSGTGDVMLKDADGNYVTPCEIHTTEYNGKILANICLYNWDGDISDVSVYYKGEKVTGMKELISDKTLGDTITVNGYKPFLLEFNAQ